MRRVILLLAGPGIWLLLRLLAPASLSREAAHVLGIAGWMALWWMTEAVPLAATSLLPFALFPLLGVSSAKEAASPYANELVFLFLAGFLFAAALERWNAHARMAYAIVSRIGGTARRVVLGVMLATAFVSLWISNTATAAMMYPIALAIGGLFGLGRGADQMRTALMLGVAYAASIGGMGTLIGTPPNILFAGAAKQILGREVGFLEFLGVGLPLVALLLPLCWALLVFLFFRSDIILGGEVRAEIRGRRAALGRLAGGEAQTLALFGVTVAAWLLRERKDLGFAAVPGLADISPRITDASIGIAGALLLFCFSGAKPEERRRPLLTWREAREIPWEVLLLFGGGLSLAAAMESSGLAAWLGSLMTGLSGYPSILLYGGLAMLVLLLSELASNTAVAALTMPIAASLAPTVGEPALALMLVAALAASTGFALPVATPPNTIVFGSGQVTVRQMARVGIVLDLLAVAAIVAAVLLLFPLVFS